MKVSEEGIKFISSFETVDGEPNLKAIKSPETDEHGKPKYEIGFGHNSDSYFRVDADSEISYEQAFDILRHDIQEAESVINKWCKNNDLFFTQQEFDAMCCALYNGVGITSIKTGICKALTAHGKGEDQPEQVKREWLKWVYFTDGKKGKVKANGLIKRRKDELRLFFEGLYQRTY